MAALGYEEAFHRFKAKLKNVNWSVCAETPKGELVISCWLHRITVDKSTGTWIYDDQLSRWSGNGNRELAEKLKQAYASNQPIKLIKVAAKDENEKMKVENGVDGSKIKKDFYIQENVTGHLTYFDGEKFVIEFKKTD